MPIFERVNKKLSFGYSERESDVSIEIKNYRQMNILFYSEKCCTVRLRWQIHVLVKYKKKNAPKWNERLWSLFPLVPVCEAFRHKKLYIYLKAAVVP